VNEETKKQVEKIRRKYKDDKDMEFLILQLSSLETRLISADVMAMCVDVAIKRGLLDARTLIGDARLNYGTPWEYEFASKKHLLGYQGGIEGVEEALSKGDKTT